MDFILYYLPVRGVSSELLPTDAHRNWGMISNKHDSCPQKFVSPVTSHVITDCKYIGKGVKEVP